MQMRILVCNTNMNSNLMFENERSASRDISPGQLPDQYKLLPHCHFVNPLNTLVNLHTCLPSASVNTERGELLIAYQSPNSTVSLDCRFPNIVCTEGLM